MTKGIVLYRSLYGATKEYATQLANYCNFDLLDITKCNINKLSKYEIIIFGGGLYAGKIKNINFLKKHLPAIKDKHLIIFTVGISELSLELLENIKIQNFSGLPKNTPLFYCRGSFDFDKLSFVHRILCSMLSKQIAKKDPTTYETWEKALMASINEKCNYIDFNNLKPIVNEMKNR
ncbi:MAG: flavodoxin domain-containing protein [Erysipelotrichaceae bacterium]|nr:flavodoxin domain-containing protein [Erysipelotrichaceae bacterium]MDY5251283.1 flavodoxin domain-containing protein [Erysipelotrichaceae bacterium]